MATILLVSDLPLALSIKEAYDCPHIHFIEEHTTPFISATLWVEALSNAAHLARQYDKCVLSFNQSKSDSCGNLHTDELSIVLEMERCFLLEFSDIDLMDIQNG